MVRSLVTVFALEIGVSSADHPVREAGILLQPLNRKSTGRKVFQTEAQHEVVATGVAGATCSWELLHSDMWCDNKLNLPAVESVQECKDLALTTVGCSKTMYSNGKSCRCVRAGEACSSKRSFSGNNVSICREAQYERLPYGSPGCPPGLEIQSWDVCWSAIESLGLAATRRWKHQSSSFSSGCSVREAGTVQKSNGEEDVAGTTLFNSQYNSRVGHSDLAPICKTGVHKDFVDELTAPTTTPVPTVAHARTELLFHNKYCKGDLRTPVWDSTSVHHCAKMVKADDDCGPEFFSTGEVCQCVGKGHSCNAQKSSSGASVYRLLPDPCSSFALSACPARCETDEGICKDVCKGNSSTFLSDHGICGNYTAIQGTIENRNTFCRYDFDRTTQYWADEVCSECGSCKDVTRHCTDTNCVGCPDAVGTCTECNEAHWLTDGQCKARWSTGTMGSKQCPAGSGLVHNDQLCQAFALALGKKFHGLKTSRSFPEGCFFDNMGNAIFNDLVGAEGAMSDYLVCQKDLCEEDQDPSDCASGSECQDGLCEAPPPPAGEVCAGYTCEDVILVKNPDNDKETTLNDATCCMQKCIDESIECGLRDLFGECQTNQAYMHISCQRSCGVC